MKIRASYSTVRSDELLAHVVPLYEIREPTSCEFWHRGLNDTYKVTSNYGSFALRVYRKDWRTLSDIEFEMEAIQYLHKNKAKVAYPIRNADGDYVTMIIAPEGERCVVLTKFLDGATLKFEEPGDAEIFGKATAEIHTKSSGFQPSHDRYKLDKQHLIEDPLSHVLPFISHRPDDIAFLDGFSQILIDKLSEAESGLLDHGFCHGDCHGYNAHDYNGEIYHFDFDCCGFGLRVFDLATFKWSSRLRKKEEEWWPRFLEGYRSKRQISERDLNYLEEFVAIRDLWLFGLHIGNARDIAKGWINDSYIDRRLGFLKDALERINLSPKGDEG